MQPRLAHSWNPGPDGARALQEELATLVVTEDHLPPCVKTVAGVDVAYEDGGTRAFAAIVVIDVVTGMTKQIAVAESRVHFPYVPGLLSFRELPALAVAFDKLVEPPDLVLCDGQGIAHPRRFGLACHIGVIYDLPAIGCAKTRLTGVGDDPDLTRGSIAPLVSAAEIIGAAVRTRDGVKPVYVSPGHRISLATACRWTLALSPHYRIPDPVRMADQLANQMKRKAA